MWQTETRWYIGVGQMVKGKKTIQDDDWKELDCPIEYMEIKVADWDESLRQKRYVETDYEFFHASECNMAVTINQNIIKFIFNDGQFKTLPNDQLEVVPRRNVPQHCWPYFDPTDESQAPQYKEQHAIYMNHLTQQVTSSLSSSDDNQPSTSRKKKPKKRKNLKSKTKTSNTRDKSKSQMPETSKKKILPVDMSDDNASINSFERE